MMNKIRLTLRRAKGFTIIDVLTGFSIFAIAIVPIFYLVKDYLIFSHEVRNRAIAYGLTLEALEILRNIRDSNYVVPAQNWLTNFATSSCLDGGSNYCVVDALEYQVSDLGVKTPLLNDSTTNLYNYSSGEVSDFYRRISYKSVPGDPDFSNAISVKIEVEFPQRVGKKEPLRYETDILLYNFYPNN